MTPAELAYYYNLAGEILPIDADNDPNYDSYVYDLRYNASDAIESLVKEVERVAGLYQEESRLRRRLEIDVRTLQKELEIERYNVAERDRLPSVYTDPYR